MTKFFVEVVKSGDCNLPQWEDEAAYTDHVRGVDEEGREACQRGAGQCCMGLTLQRFDQDERTVNGAEVAGTVRVESGTSINCPDQGHIIRTLRSVTNGADGEELTDWGVSKPA